MAYSNKTEGRILGVDLSDLPEENMAALRQEAISLNVSLPELLGSLISDKSAALVNRIHPGDEAGAPGVSAAEKPSTI